MYKTMLIASTLFVLQSNFIYSDTQKNNTPKNTKTKKSSSLQYGQTINFSEFTKTNSGIMFKIVTKGSGEKPLLGENLVVDYTGYLLVDGKKIGSKFDSSLDRNQPFSFKLGARQVIQGWEISLADMKIGETRIVILPANLAYGSRATSQIPANSTLVFEITLHSAS
ncbi:MAG: FKBP-type peptidyl-prolyl cis-trans isomerase [Candidatus Chromulinivorax sp.]